MADKKHTATPAKRFSAGDDARQEFVRSLAPLKLVEVMRAELVDVIDQLENMFALSTGVMRNLRDVPDDVETSRRLHSMLHAELAQRAHAYMLEECIKRLPEILGDTAPGQTEPVRAMGGAKDGLNVAWVGDCFDAIRAIAWKIPELEDEELQTTVLALCEKGRRALDAVIAGDPQGGAE